MTVDEALKFSCSAIGGEQGFVDSNYLLSHLLNKDFTWLKTWSNNELSHQQIIEFKALVERRVQGEPVAYLTGEKDFWSLTLETNPSTLIPRPETEMLVEKALNFLQNKISAKVLDLGTGTGAIALAIASERNGDEITATDFVHEAVKLAKKNALKNKISNVKIFQSDWFSNIEEKKFDLVVSNPPYIEENDPHLEQGDLRFEPISALSAKDKGFANIKQIAEAAKSHLRYGGCLMFEHGFKQAEDVKIILSGFGYRNIKTFKDLAGLERITLGIFENRSNAN